MSKLLTPFLHQQETIDKLNEQFKQNNNKGLVVLPSGSGKTNLVAFHVNQLKPASFLYIIHRDVILIQTIESFKRICGLDDSQIGIINSKNKDYDKPFLFTTIQTLSRQKNLYKISKNIEYMVIDEYHHVAAKTYQAILEYFTPKYLVGLTATPYRLDEKDIMDPVNNLIVNEIDLFEGIDKKILVPFHYLGLYDDIDYSKIKHYGYNYKITDLDRKLIIHKRDEAVIKEYNEKIRAFNRHQTIGFCNSINHVNRIASKFRANGINAIGITHHESIETRAEIITGFRNGKYDVLFTRDILNEGVDFPECSALMFLRPTISKTIFLQQLGRGLRKKQGKEDVLVLDFIGNYIRAFDKKKWFLDYLKKGQHYSGKYIKPVYEYNHPKPIVEFDSKVIEMMDIQEKLYRDRDRFNSFHILPLNKQKQELMNNYESVKQKALEEYNRVHKTKHKTLPGHILNNREISKYTLDIYKKTFGTYRKFLHSFSEVKCDFNNDFLDFNFRMSEYQRDKKIRKAITLLQKKLGRKQINVTEFQKEYKNFASIVYGKMGWKEFCKKYKIASHTVKVCVCCGRKFFIKIINKNDEKITCSQLCGNKYKRIVKSLKKQDKDR